MHFWIMLISLFFNMVHTQDRSPGSTTTVDCDSVVVLVARKPQASSHAEPTGEMIVLRHDRDRCFWTYLNRFGKLSSGEFKIDDGYMQFSHLSTSAEDLARNEVNVERGGVDVAVISDSHEYRISTGDGIRKLLEDPLLRQLFGSLESAGKSGKSLIFFDDVLWSHTDFIREGRPVRPK